MVTVNSVLIFIRYTKMGTSANPDMTLELEVFYQLKVKCTCRIGAVLCVPRQKRTFLQPGNFPPSLLSSRD